jgi:hypothetical protein
MFQTATGHASESEAAVAPLRMPPGFAEAQALHRERLAVAREAAAQITAWQARLVEATEALLQTQCSDPWTHYLPWALGMTSSEARELVELVDRLSELPATRDVMSTGERSLRSVLSIARRATPDTEERILTDTEALTGNQLERTLREYGRVVAPSRRTDDTEREPASDRDPDPSSARWWTRNGRLQIRGDYDPVDTTALLAWLEAERATAQADGGEDEPSVVEPYQRTCADALFRLAERAASTRASDVGFAPESITTNLIIHAHETPDGEVQVDRSFIPGVGPMPTWSLDMLVEHGPLVATVMVDGEPIMAAEPVRLATRAQKRAALARDGGCAFPGCGATRHLIAHHIRYHDQGGPTELRNLVLLCRRHHRVVHRQSLRILPDPEAPPDRFRWRFLDHRGELLRPGSLGRAPCREVPGAERRTGAGEQLTTWGLDVILHAWLTDDERRTVPASAADAAAA